ncbi:hypothetical protein WJX74_003585 [Apatococcus lobatus]|uniref:Uncharacterized protein n=1 Tax=Apatococcus lobatus TaxID=904363 RepID=A0AAW1QTP1_9CHLO
MPVSYVDVNFPNPGRDGDTRFIIYGYRPSISLGIVGSIFFGAYGIASLCALIRPRRAGAILLLIGVLFEVVGYICRCLSSQVDPYFLAYFVCQYFFIVVAPVFFAAAIYLDLSRLIAGITGNNKPPVSPRLILAIFVTFDVITTIVQIAGAASIGSAESNNKNPAPATDILIVGLAVQTAAFLVFLVIFLVVIARLQLRMRSLPAGAYAALADAHWQFALLFCSAVLVQLRTAFRLAESSQGVGGYLSSHTVYFGCLEFLPIVLAVFGLLMLEVAFKRSWGSFTAVGTPGQSLTHPQCRRHVEASKLGGNEPRLDST